MPKGIPREPSFQKSVLHRLKIARGHLNKVINMTEQGHYCIDVINQSLAVQNALKKANSILLENHLQTCVRDAINRGETDEATKEIVQVLENMP